ncbi:MAG TPA: UPF0182 family protein [Spirochaetota bacterium]|nr:UPF0182 family protein [Spirochaetota bacterium]
MKTGIKVLVFIGAIVLIIVALFVGTNIWLNFVWFGKLGFLNVFVKILWTKIGLWWGFFAIFCIFAGLNVFRAFKRGNIQTIKIQQAGVPIEMNRKVSIIVASVVLLIMGLIMARYGSSKWDLVLKLLNRASFDLKDPVFGRDVSFFVFNLPVYNFLKSWSLGTVILTFIVVGLLYLISGQITVVNNKFTASDQSKKHLITLLFLVTLIFAWNYLLKVFMILYSRKGIIYGAGFTDVKVSRPGYYIMIAVSLLAAVLTFIGIKKRSFKQPLIAYGLLIGLAIVITGIVPGIVQQISVKPNELVKELPFIENNINFTRRGYNLDIIEREQFPVNDSLSAEDFSPEKGIVKNIRLWDHRPLKLTFSQIQEFRLYYDFYDVDVDRYHFGDEYRQVMLSAREINYNELPPEAQRWVNQKLVYTHGYGFVMTPVNEIGEEGLPVLLAMDIPPKISVPLKMDRPEIYYGEETIPYVIVNTDQPEFDYPKGDANEYTKYQGTGGIPIKNGLRKLWLTIRLRSLEIIFTGSLNPESRVMIHRSIQERVPKIAPFLKYDPNPYLVVHDGKLFWLLDAYTTTDRFPYSSPYKDGYNYIRNSIKVTVDAYTGDVNYYTIDPNDPLIKTYSNIFPGMFKDISEMPDGLLAHVRYPMYIFSVQAELYSTYHMTDPQVFYNKEDKWTTPREIYEQSETDMIPYYTIIKFPDDVQNEEFVLIIPFTPTNKNNMLAWMAAMCDPESYGRIVEYKFPKEKLLYGPLQIESRIDQNSEISQLFTLWGQKGSSVIRGNLLVIPVKDSLIYVEPIYLRAEQSELPEMKRVIVGYQDRIGIGLTLEEALYKVFGTRTPESAEFAAAEEPGGVTPLAVFRVDDLIHKANNYFAEAQNRLKQGDFAGYGEYVDELKKVLSQLEAETSK